MSNKLKAKIYSVLCGDEQILVKTFTRQQAVAYVAQKTIVATYATQQILYEATKAGCEIVDLSEDPNQRRLPYEDEPTGEDQHEDAAAAQVG